MILLERQKIIKKVPHNAGINPPLTGNRWDDPITASMWTDNVPGWSKVRSLQRGDIVSNGTHCGIAVGSSRIMSGCTQTVHDKYAFNSNRTIQRYSESDSESDSNDIIRLHFEDHSDSDSSSNNCSIS